MDNREVLRGVFKTDDLGTPGYGLMGPEQVDAFYEVAEEQIPWMQLQRTIPTKNHTGTVPRIDYGDDVIRPATEAVDSGFFVEPTRDNVNFTQVKGRTAFKVSNETFTQSEDPQLQNKLINGFTRAWGRSDQKVAWNGDATSTDPMLQINDGWGVAMDTSGNPVDGSGINAGVIDIAHFQHMLESLPEAWQQRADELRWAMTRKKFNQYTKSLSGRATGSGDIAIERGADGVPMILGIPVTEVPSLTATGDNDKIALTSPQNTVKVQDPTYMKFVEVSGGITLAAQDVRAWIGFEYCDYVVPEPEGTAWCYNLDN
jgi:HK97 family phage major capsid protein